MACMSECSLLHASRFMHAGMRACMHGLAGYFIYDATELRDQAAMHRAANWAICLLHLPCRGIDLIGGPGPLAVHRLPLAPDRRHHHLRLPGAIEISTRRSPQTAVAAAPCRPHSCRGGGQAAAFRLLTRHCCLQWRSGWATQTQRAPLTVACDA